MTRSTSRRRVAVSLGAAAIVAGPGRLLGERGNWRPGRPARRQSSGPAPPAGAGRLGAPSDRAAAADGSLASSPPRGPGPDRATRTRTSSGPARSRSRCPKIDPALLQVRTRDRRPGRLRERLGPVQRRRPGHRPRSPTASRSPAGRTPSMRSRESPTKVDSAKSNATEVTGQVLDLGARIDNLRDDRARPPGDHGQGDEDQRRPGRRVAARATSRARSSSSAPSRRTSRTRRRWPP